MVSRRKFFSIAIMMFVLLFMFQFSMVLRDRQNTYDVNSNLAPKQNDGKNVWKNEELDPASVGTTDRRYVLFVGDSSSDMAEAVSRWCTYAKWDISKCSSMEKFKENDKNLPGMLILESEKYALDDNLKKIEELEQKGVIIVFGCLEDPKNIEKNQELQDFLGIYKIVSKKTELTGAKLFEGLLLGGEVIYETPEDKDERDRQDLQLNVPWYQVGSGTKTYMVGLLDQSKQKETVENEELPTLIWRNGIRNGSIFCVVGDYMKDSTALGLLDGMVAEASSYYIYPVVNAQNLSMINFPVFADENNEQMMELYSQSITGMARDIMWPSLISIVEKGGLKMSCFMQPQTNYEDGIEPTSKNLVFYLKQMKEQNAEAGLSLQYKNAESLRDKLNQDAEFFRKADSSYKYGAAYTEEKDLDTNVMLNMQKIFWPERKKDRWQIMQKRFSSNLLTYWKKFTGFDSTTLSESNTRTRTFLNLDFSETRTDDEIILKTSESGSWFILRTHGEEIEEIEGGTQKKLEDNVYLIQAQDTTVKIQVKTAGLHYSK